MGAVTTDCLLLPAAGHSLLAAAVPLPAADVSLLAAGWEQVVIAIVAIGIWALNQFLGARNKAAPPARRIPPPVARPGQPAGGQPGGGQQGLLDEVEQFLKDARKQMEQQQRPQPQQQRPPPRIQPPPVPQQARKQKQQQAKARPKPPRQPARPPLSETRPLDDIERGSSVEQHVREHIGTDRFDTSAFDERAGKLSHLQQTIEQDIGAHVRSVFDHQVGTMTTGSASSAAPPEAPTGPSPAQQLFAMLREPQGLRNAILLQEVLRPPVDRW
jgi:hypothetical protein